MTERVQLVWFDPGGITGWAVATLRADWLLGQGNASWEGLRTALHHHEFGQVGDGHAEMLGEAELANIRFCYEVLAGYPDAAWGFEDFVVGSFNSGRDFLAPVRIFSALVFADSLHEYGRQPHRQSAANAKSTATDERMKAAKLYKPGQPHATDALRHIATFFRRCRSSEHDPSKSAVAAAELRVGAWPEVFA